jgi:large conductance mechanosensitive channel
MLKEFKTFIARGNVIDMAVGIVVGAAFTAIVTSLVSDVINPVIGMLLGGLDFSNYYADLSFSGYESLEAAKKAGAPLIMYGLFLNAVIKFLIVSFVVFMLVKQINRLKAAPPAADTPPPEDIQLLREIRDALKK